MNPDQPPSNSSNHWPVLLASILFALIAGAFILFFIRTRAAPRPPACVHNLLQIDGAKEQWALENQKPVGAPVTLSDIPQINQYIKGGSPLTCPNGGTYQYNPIDTKPTCTIPGHTI